jgi:glycosyltransferase involved in cell wall biosynthesis
MRILMIAHALWRRTGYGAPVLPWANALKAQGHEVVVLAVQERGPGVTEFGGLKVYLPFRSTWGEDVYAAICDRERIDVIVSLFDPWVLQNMRGFSEAGRPWLAWCPIDQDPPQRGLAQRLENATLTLSFSEYGRDVLARAHPHLPVKVMPYGVDTAVFKPDLAKRVTARKALGLPDNAFLVGMCGTNLPGDRKALAQNIAGFCEFAGDHPEAYLVLWTTALGGVNIRAYLNEFGPVAERVLLVSQWDTAYGGQAVDMAEFYNSLDVLLHASAAEGFGIAIIEALACGVPVIGAANTSMRELIPGRVGWLVHNTRAEWSALDGWWNRPEIAGVAEVLSIAQRDIAEQAISPADCVAWARGYDWAFVAEQWGDVLAKVMGAARADKSRAREVVA